MGSERLFPIMPALRDTHAVRDLRNAGCEAIVIGIPWGMLVPHERQAQANHQQSLERLAERGGLSAVEAVNVITGKRWGTSMPAADANRKLSGMVRRWRAGRCDARDYEDLTEALVEQIDEERAWFKAQGLVHPADASYADAGEPKEESHG